MDILKTLNDYAQLINFALLLAVIGLLFQLNGMYRVNIKEQISTLKEENNLLKERLAKMESESPLVVTENIKKRLQLTEEDYKRLDEDLQKLAEYTHEQVETIAQYKTTFTEIERFIQELGENFEKLPKELDDLKLQLVKGTLQVLIDEGLIKGVSEFDND